MAGKDKKFKDSTFVKIMCVILAFLMAGSTVFYVIFAIVDYLTK